MHGAEQADSAGADGAPSNSPKARRLGAGGRAPASVDGRASGRALTQQGASWELPKAFAAAVAVEAAHLVAAGGAVASEEGARYRRCWKRAQAGRLPQRGDGPAEQAQLEPVCPALCSRLGRRA